jgi:hypothetical protein
MVSVARRISNDNLCAGRVTIWTSRRRGHWKADSQRTYNVDNVLDVVTGTSEAGQVVRGDNHTSISYALAANQYIEILIGVSGAGLTGNASPSGSMATMPT